jgi:hypothetical protein
MLVIPLLSTTRARVHNQLSIGSLSCWIHHIMITPVCTSSRVFFRLSSTFPYLFRHHLRRPMSTNSRGSQKFDMIPTCLEESSMHDGSETCHCQSLAHCCRQCIRTLDKSIHACLVWKWEVVLGYLWSQDQLRADTCHISASLLMWTTDRHFNNAASFPRSGYPCSSTRTRWSAAQAVLTMT